jgi:6,7-dimethyl-8-ribityllumazine synthase
MLAPSSRVRVVEGSLDAAGLRFAVLVARFNAIITEPLLDGAVDALLRSGANEADVVVFRTPGSYELPMLADRVLATGKFDAVVALGCLIRGDTIHFDLIAGEAAKGLAAVGIARGKPVAFGVLTTDDLEQAFHRAGAKAGNKGSEAATAAIEQARLYRAIEAESGGGPGTP